MSLIVTSHQHFDHWQALEAVAEATGAPTAAHEIDAEPLPVKPDRLLADGDTVQIGELTFHVIHLRGHTPGSVALALTDPLPAASRSCSPATAYFPGGVGKTWQPGDFAQLISDVTSKVFEVYPDSTVIYPGHGDDTMGAERPQPRGVARTRLVMPRVEKARRLRGVHDQHVDLGPA